MGAPWLKPDGMKGKHDPWTLKECGSTAAYRRHMRNGEKPCLACASANRVAMMLWKDANRGKVLEQKRRYRERKKMSDKFNSV
jgi:hypothetical protein